MTRRQVIAATGAVLAASRLKAADTAVPAHYLPENESQYKRVKGYIDETQRSIV